jgi:peptidoglycan hydrolase-like protein with peptidoglycan-binding domain
MAGFIKSVNLDAKLRVRDWTGFARGYNGPSYWRNQYDVKLKAAFEKFSSGVGRDLRARAAQGALQYLGYNPGDPDGIVGQNTRNAVAAFRKNNNFGAGGDLDDAVFTAIMEKAGLA